MAVLVISANMPFLLKPLAVGRAGGFDGAVPTPASPATLRYNWHNVFNWCAVAVATPAPPAALRFDPILLTVKRRDDESQRPLDDATAYMMLVTCNTQSGLKRGRPRPRVPVPAACNRWGS
jgi:hypothetical protein